MKYNRNIYNRCSIRLKNYDYSQQGFYFPTICTQDRLNLFGEIVDEKMALNDAGQMVEKWYLELKNKFLDIKLHDYIIMPNHIHFIIQNLGADLSVRPDNSGRYTKDRDEYTSGANKYVQGMDKHERSRCEQAEWCLKHEWGEHTGSPLQSIVQWFKTMTTNEYIRRAKQYGWQPFPGKLWQRNYYEHIVRNETSYLKLSEYIMNNPLNWKEDDYYDSQNQ